MAKIIKATVITLALGFTMIYAESTHDNAHDTSKKEHKHDRYDHLKNEVSKETVEKAAKKKVESLVAEKKIHKSWKSVPISKIGKTHYGDTNDWVVGFDNMKIKNKKRRTLYIFVNVRGEIRGANYTGN